MKKQNEIMELRGNRPVRCKIYLQNRILEQISSFECLEYQLHL